MLLYTKERGEEQGKMDKNDIAMFQLAELNNVYEFMTSGDTTDDRIISYKIFLSEWYIYHLSYGNLQIAEVYFSLIERVRELERRLI